MCITIDFDRDWLFYRGELAPSDETDMWGGAKARAYFYGAAAENADLSKWSRV